MIRALAALAIFALCSCAASTPARCAHGLDGSVGAGPIVIGVDLSHCVWVDAGNDTMSCIGARALP
jgi:hypothetical protein